MSYYPYEDPEPDPWQEIRKLDPVLWKAVLKAAKDDPGGVFVGLQLLGITLLLLYSLMDRFFGLLGVH